MSSKPAGPAPANGGTVAHTRLSAYGIDLWVLVGRRSADQDQVGALANCDVADAALWAQCFSRVDCRPFQGPDASGDRVEIEPSVRDALI
jgi:hypothetical protein